MAEKQNIDDTQSIHPYMFKPKKGEEEFSDSSESSTSDDEGIDQDFETANSWRLSTLDWCKCGNCSVMDKTIESFCRHEKATEYDESDEKLTNAENQGFQCITNLTCFSKICCQRKSFISMCYSIWKRTGLSTIRS